MKIEKNKIVFALVLLSTILFIGGYAMLVIGDDESPNIENNQIPVPKLEDEQKEYESKLDALNDLKEVRQTNAPSIYDERLLDSTGVYDPDLLSKEKMRIVDSIYHYGRIDYTKGNYRQVKPEVFRLPIKSKVGLVIQETKPLISVKEKGVEHQLFFSSNPSKNSIKNITKGTDAFIHAVVDGDQTVKANYRLRMRLLKAATIQGELFPKNTYLYGFISFKPNRAMISIENINHSSTKLKAFDLQDGCEGIYIENSFRAEAIHEVVGDLVDDINITGIPQVTGIKKVFQRNNRSVKVTIANNYIIILKPLKNTY